MYRRRKPSGFALVAFCRVCSNPGSVIPHTLHKLRLRCLNGKKAIAAIPNAVEQCTSLYIAQRQVFLTKNLLLSGTTAIHGGSELDILVNSWTRVFCKQKTSLLFRTSGIRAASECTSWASAGHEFAYRKLMSSGCHGRHCHGCSWF